MSDPFNARNWYWIVAGDETKVYSSAAGDYVQSTHKTYQAWIASGNAPSRIASEDELGEVLDPYALRPVAAGVLDKYLEKQAGRLTLEIAAKVLLSHENRLRALEGKQAINAAGFKTAIKALL